MTLRHRLESVIKTEHEVRTSDPSEECPMSPGEIERPKIAFQKFPSKVVIPTENLRTKMLVGDLYRHITYILAFTPYMYMYLLIYIYVIVSAPQRGL